MSQPIYLKVKQLIEDDIKQLVPNAMIQSERDLAIKYEVISNDS